MAEKPSYEELQQRVAALERELADRDATSSTLRNPTSEAPVARSGSYDEAVTKPAIHQNVIDKPAAVVIGSINVDFHVSHVTGFEERDCTVTGKLETTPGGKGANEAVALARLGVKTKMFAHVGRDGLESQATEVLREAGVDLRDVTSERSFKVPTGVATILKLADSQGEYKRTVCCVGANDKLDLDFEEARSHLEQAFASAGILLIQLECNLVANQMACMIARSHPKKPKIILRLSPLTALTPTEGEVPLEVELFRTCHVLVANEREIAHLLRYLKHQENLKHIHIRETGALGTIKECCQAALTLLSESKDSILEAVVIPTEIGAVCAYFDSQKNPRLCVAPSREVDKEDKEKGADYIGAADAFAAGVARAVLQKRTQEEWLYDGQICGALSTKRKGAQPPMPTESAVEQWKRNFPPIKKDFSAIAVDTDPVRSEPIEFNQLLIEMLHDTKLWHQKMDQRVLLDIHGQTLLHKAIIMHHPTAIVQLLKVSIKRRHTHWDALILHKDRYEMDVVKLSERYLRHHAKFTKTMTAHQRSNTMLALICLTKLWRRLLQPPALPVTNPLKTATVSKDERAFLYWVIKRQDQDKRDEVVITNPGVTSTQQLTEINKCNKSLGEVIVNAFRELMTRTIDNHPDLVQEYLCFLLEQLYKVQPDNFTELCLLRGKDGHQILHLVSGVKPGLKIIQLIRKLAEKEEDTESSWAPSDDEATVEDEESRTSRVPSQAAIPTTSDSDCSVCTTPSSVFVPGFIPVADKLKGLLLSKTTNGRNACHFATMSLDTGPENFKELCDWASNIRMTETLRQYMSRVPAGFGRLETEAFVSDADSPTKSPSQSLGAATDDASGVNIKAMQLSNDVKTMLKFELKMLRAKDNAGHLPLEALEWKARAPYLEASKACYAFISYAREVSEGFVKKLHGQLTEVFPSVWIDQKSLEGGDHWREEITRRCTRCSVFILILSKKWLESEYCQAEFSLQLQRGRKIAVVIPQFDNPKDRKIGYQDDQYVETHDILERAAEIQRFTNFYEESHEYTGTELDVSTLINYMKQAVERPATTGLATEIMTIPGTVIDMPERVFVTVFAVGATLQFVEEFCILLNQNFGAPIYFIDSINVRESTKDWSELNFANCTKMFVILSPADVKSCSEVYRPPLMEPEDFKVIEVHPSVRSQCALAYAGMKDPQYLELIYHVSNAQCDYSRDRKAQLSKFIGGSAVTDASECTPPQVEDEE
eukprot:m.234043 g.234043  ORF g.234043 m.234043 type:complete len:1225 (+) comp15252_c0_seq6:294-3968(+)